MRVSVSYVYQLENFKTFPNEKFIKRMEELFKEPFFEYDGTLGGYIRYHRLQLGLRSGVMAEKLGISPYHYSQIENNNRKLSLRYVILLSEKGGMSLSQLIEKYKVERKNCK